MAMIKATIILVVEGRIFNFLRRAYEIKKERRNRRN